MATLHALTEMQRGVEVGPAQPQPAGDAVLVAALRRGRRGAHADLINHTD